MLVLNKECCYLVWEYVGFNAIFLNKELIELLNLKKKLFIKNPLKIYYKLAKFKEIKTNSNIFSNRISRPSVVVEKETKFINLNGTIPFGRLTLYNKILPSDEIINIIVPEPKIVEICGNRYFNYKYKFYHWEIFSIYCEKCDIKRANIYQLLFSTNKFQKTNILNIL